MSSRQYENIMRGLVVVNENLKAISKKLFKKGYIPVWESEDKVQEPLLKNEVDKVNEELAGKEPEEIEKEIDLSTIPF